MSALELQTLHTPESIAGFRSLLKTYYRIRKYDAALGDWQKELDELPGPFGPPHGLGLLALWDSRPAGCVAFRQLDDTHCEMKRLFVDPAFRGKGIGEELCRALISRAAEQGYRAMRLDTHPTMHRARELYRRLGFIEVERYNANPTPGIRFFEKDLKKEPPPSQG